MPVKKKANLKKIPVTVYLVCVVALIVGFALGYFYNRSSASKDVVVSPSSSSQQAESNQVVAHLIDEYNSEVKTHNALIEDWNVIAPQWWTVRKDGATGSAPTYVAAKCLATYQVSPTSILRYQVAEACP